MDGDARAANAGLAVTDARMNRDTFVHGVNVSEPSIFSKRSEAAEKGIYPSVHPLRYSRRRNCSASAAFGMRIAAVSHWSFLPARYATLPRWFASVRRPL